MAARRAIAENRQTGLVLVRLCFGHQVAGLLLRRWGRHPLRHQGGCLRWHCGLRFLRDWRRALLWSWLRWGLHLLRRQGGCLRWHCSLRFFAIGDGLCSGAGVGVASAEVRSGVSTMIRSEDGVGVCSAVGVALTAGVGARVAFLRRLGRLRSVDRGWLRSFSICLDVSDSSLEFPPHHCA